MELDEFISGTLQAIIKAVNDSKVIAEANNAIVNPILMEREFDALTTIWRKDGKDGRRALTKIDFDVAVTASSEEGSETGGGLKIQVLSLGKSISSNEVSQTSSRVKFSINVALPHQGDK